MAALFLAGIEVEPPNPLNVNYVPEGIDDPRMVDKRFLFIRKYNRKVGGEYGDKFIPQPDYFRSVVWDAWVDLSIMFSERHELVKEGSPIVMEVIVNEMLRTMDFKQLNKLVRPFTELVDTIMEPTWTCNSAVASAMLRHNLEERHLNLMIFLIQVTKADPKEVTPQEYQFLDDVFDICEQCVVNSENAIKVSYAWTFAGWTDNLKDEIPSFGENDFVTRILKTCRNMLAVPTKAKYNCRRACGNVFAWLKESHLEVPEIKVRIEELTDALVPLIGSGADYKVPIVEQLAMKLPISQNFNEQSICLAALCKVSSKGMYGQQYVGIWKKLLDSLGKPPVESSDSNNKFNIECLKLFFHLVVTLEPDNLNGLSDCLNSNVDYLREVIERTIPSLLSEQMNKAMAAPDVFKTVKENTRDESDLETVTVLSDLVDMSLRISQSQRYI
ncbi:unnamed protein product [Orchesella dallaii]|uniref:Uncharacterized protein n=1 Tax=Orchesella dallaii TaxID=48710 RepID=A0ABP1PMR0_9HEXA